MNKRIFNLKINFGHHPNSLTFDHIKLSQSKIDYRSRFKFVYDQGNLGSCTANSLCYCYIFDYPNYNPSRLYLYHNQLVLQNNINDIGSTLENCINAFNKFGICTEKSWPYIISKFRTTPSLISYQEGKQCPKNNGVRVSQTLSALKGCLASGEPFICGFLVFSSFMSLNVARTGYVPMPKRNEILLGGHAVICIGYDDTKQVFIMLNSWGSNWGDKGFFYIPYAYLTNINLAGDFWKLVVTNQKPVKSTKYNKMILKIYHKI